MELFKDIALLTICMNFVFLVIRFSVHCLTGSLSNPFDFIPEKKQGINENKSFYYDVEKNRDFYYEIEEIDKPYKINLSKDKSGE